MYPCVQVIQLKEWFGSARLSPRNILPNCRRQNPSHKAVLQSNFEVLDSKKANGLKKIVNGDFKRSVFNQEEAAQKRKKKPPHGKATRMDDL